MWRRFVVTVTARYRAAPRLASATPAVGDAMPIEGGPKERAGLHAPR